MQYIIDCTCIVATLCVTITAFVSSTYILAMYVEEYNVTEVGIEFHGLAWGINISIPNSDPYSFSNSTI